MRVQTTIFLRTHTGPLRKKIEPSPSGAVLHPQRSSVGYTLEA